jgi:hypothetical protein
MSSLASISRYCRDDDTVVHHEIEICLRWSAMNSGPVSQLGYCELLGYITELYIPAEWREEVEELLVALKALTAAQISSMVWEMAELLSPHTFRFLHYCRARQLKRTEEDLLMKKAVDTEERSVTTESTDAESYSSYSDFP